MPAHLARHPLGSREDPEPNEGSDDTDMVQRMERFRRLLEIYCVPPWGLHGVLRDSLNEESIEIPISALYYRVSSPLKNSLHPLLLRTYWSDEVQSDDSVSDCLEPVLRLASRFVSENALMPFLYNLLFEKKLLPRSPTGHERLQSFCVDSPLRPEQLELTKPYLQALSDDNHITFEFFTEEKSGWKAYGMTVLETWDENMDSTARTSRTCLNKNFMNTLHAHHGDHRLLTPCRLLTVRSKMAMTICHELCHSINGLTDNSKYETYFMSQQTSELGRAWECWRFGGMIHLHGAHFDGRAGLACEDWPSIRDGVIPRGWIKKVAASLHLRKIHAIPANNLGAKAAPWRGPLVDSMIIWSVEMEYILKIQTEEFWKGEFALHGVEALRIPKHAKVSSLEIYKISTVDRAGGEKS